MSNKQKIFFFGVLLLSVVFIFTENNNDTHQIIRISTIAFTMFMWWVSEALPIAMTSLLPICVFPLFDIMPLNETTKYYSNKVIYLMLSGFLLGIALQKWKLNYRIALNILRIVGNHPARIILGFMISTALLSMWVSNTATSIIMLPVAVSFLTMITNSKQQNKNSNFPKILVLSIAYAASIGGMGSIIGTPTNAILAAYLSETHNINISFAKWLLCFFPLVAILIIAMWRYLLRYITAETLTKEFAASDFINIKLQELGKMNYEEKAVSIIFSLLAFLWLFKSYLPIDISDSAIGIACCSLFFVVNSKDKKDFLLNWHDTKSLPWGILILFGGGIALAKGLETSGMINLIAEYFNYLNIQNIFLTIIFFTLIVIILTEIMSNMALITIFIPILAIISISLSNSPFTLTIPAVLAASCAFMLPMATPPNAVILSSEYITIKTMIKIGFAANLIAMAVIVLYSYFIVNFW